MKKIKYHSSYSTLLIVMFISCSISTAFAQTFTREEFNDSIKKLPYFSAHKDNYFITGVPTNTKINSSTANAKYQISLKQIITKDVLPWNTHLYMTYTQKAFWNIYKESYPLSDINFNPSIALAKPIFNKENLLKGMLELSLEHESNGRDSIYSRSWNRIGFKYATNILKNTAANFQAWIPWGYKKNNGDYLEYVGLGEINISHILKKDKLEFGLMLRKGLNFKGKGVVRARIYYNPFTKNLSNQFMMLEWYVGQAEGMLNYQQSSSMLRIGYVIKSNQFGFFRGKK